jgi:hypothetical protein
LFHVDIRDDDFIHTRVIRETLHRDAAHLSGPA